jgi:hypothetical protein
MSQVGKVLTRNILENRLLSEFKIPLNCRSDGSGNSCDVSKIPATILLTLCQCLKGDKRTTGRSTYSIQRHRRIITEWFERIQSEGQISTELAIKLRMALPNGALRRLGLETYVLNASCLLMSSYSETLPQSGIQIDGMLKFTKISRTLK